MVTWLGKQERLCAGRWCTYETVFAYLFIDCEKGLEFMQESEEMITLTACHEEKNSKPSLCAAVLIGISIQAYNGASRVD